MFTEREDFDVFHDDQLIVVLMEHSTIHNVPQILLIALGEEEHSLCISLRRLQQTFSVGIFPYTFQDRPDSAAQLSQSCAPLLFSFFLSLARAKTCTREVRSSISNEE